jgi:hypothetical protein
MAAGLILGVQLTDDYYYGSRCPSAGRQQVEVERGPLESGGGALLLSSTGVDTHSTGHIEIHLILVNFLLEGQTSKNVSLRRV